MDARQGVKKDKRERLEQAIANFDRTIYIDRRNWQAYLGRGKANLALQRQAEAYSDFQAALRLKPEHVETYICLGQLYSSANLSANAIKCYNTALLIDRDCAAAYHSRGNIYAKCGDQSQAIEDYSAALAVDQYNPDALYGRALAFLHQRKNVEALRDFGAIMQNTHSDARTYIGRGYAYLALRCFGHANIDFTAALTLQPNKISAYLYRGFTLRAMEDLNASARDFRAVFKHAKSLALKIYAGLQLLELSAEAEYIPVEKIALVSFIAELAQQPIKTAEDLAVLAIAQDVMGETELAQQSFRDLFSIYLPDALPPYLHADFIRFVSSPSCRVLLNFAQATSEYKSEIKKQIVAMILSLDDRELVLNAGIRALCSASTLGGILHLQRSKTKPNLTKGSLSKLASALEYILMSKSPRNLSVKIDLATEEILAAEVNSNPLFGAKLAQYYPHLCRFVKKYLGYPAVTVAVDQAPRFFSSRANTSIQSAVMAEEGNRFINEL